MAYKLTAADLLDRLREQVSLLEASSGAFDNGYEGEAKRLATSIRVLVHDTGNSKSLLRQLDLKERLVYVDTADPINPRNLLSTPGLVIGEVTTGAGGKYIAPLDDLMPPRIKPPKAFDLWWQRPVTKTGDGTLYSRKEYVLIVANEEGGAHVDPSLDESWIRLTKDNALGWMYFEEEDVEKPFERNPALASVRQISHELLKTLGSQVNLGEDADPTNLIRPHATTRIAGRNDPCPCGSGKKYKNCHGA